jgi:CubicO group peptidase (beta-lactamase class C family)
VRPCLPLPLLLVVVAAVAWGPLQADDSSPPETGPAEGLTTSPPSPGKDRSDSDELRPFLDQLFQQAMHEHGIPGLAAVLVQNGAVVYSAGFGWADVEQQVPVDPATTVFPFGSISKLFTTLAVLQAVENGQLELDADVQTYVAPLAIDDSFPDPITLRHLLTHTDGLDPRWLFGGATTDPSRLPSLAQLLQRLPPRIEPPGQLYLYSDVGISLAARALENVSGQSFADHLDRQVLQPLGMERSSFEPWQSAEAQTHRATGYERGPDGANRRLPVVYPTAVAAGGLQGPVLDLVPLMLAQLTPANSPAPITPMVRQLMSTRQFSHHESIPGTCFGYYEYFRQGERGLLHGGLVPGFTSVVFLLPDHQTGLAVVVNQFGLVSLLEEQLLQRYLDRYHPGVPPRADPPAALAEASAGVRRPSLAGRYRSDQYSRHSTDKLALASGWGSEIVVQEQPGGRLWFEPGGSWQPVGADVFEHESTSERVVFRRDARGRGERIVGSPQFMSYHRLRWFDRLAVHGGVTAVFVTSVLAVASVAGVSSWRASRRTPRATPPAVKVVRVLTLLTVLLVVGTVAGIVLTMQEIDAVSAFLGELPLLKLTVQFPVWFTVTGLLGLVFAAFTRPVVWPDRAERRAHLLLGLAVALFLPVLAYWNLLAWPVSIGPSP